MEMPKEETIDRAIKLFGEVVLPGASLLMDGKVVSGGAHVVAGALAKAVIGPVGTAVVIANSYAESTTGTNLLKHLSKFAQDVQAAGSAMKASSEASSESVSEAASPEATSEPSSESSSDSEE